MKTFFNLAPFAVNLLCAGTIIFQMNDNMRLKSINLQLQNELRVAEESLKPTVTEIESMIMENRRVQREIDELRARNAAGKDAGVNYYEPLGPSVLESNDLFDSPQNTPK